MTPELKREVLAVYQSANKAVSEAGPICDSSGRCCRFKEFGHTLFISHFEAEILLEHAPPFDIPTSRDGCPFQVNNLCTARDSRPLGCRIYFCAPHYEEIGNRITEEALAKLKKLADQHDAGWRYAPLHDFLDEAPRVQSSHETAIAGTLTQRLELIVLTGNT